MPEGRCQNKDCNRLIFDTEKTDMLPAKIECQHCHHVNVVSSVLMSKEEKSKRRAATRRNNRAKKTA